MAALKFLRENKEAIQKEFREKLENLLEEFCPGVALFCDYEGDDIYLDFEAKFDENNKQVQDAMRVRIGSYICK